MKRIYRFLTVGLLLLILGGGYFFANLTIFKRTFIQQLKIDKFAS